MNKPTATAIVHFALGAVIACNETTTPPPQTAKIQQTVPEAVKKPQQLQPDKQTQLASNVQKEKDLREKLDQTPQAIQEYCQRSSNYCLSNTYPNYISTVSADVRNQCGGQLQYADQQKCENEEMIRRGKIDKLLKYYEEVNACLTDIVDVCIAKQQKTGAIMADPEFNVERVKQALLEAKAAGRLFTELSPTDKEICENIGIISNNVEMDPLAVSFNTKPDKQTYAKLMAGYTKRYQVREQCKDRLTQEGKVNAAIAQLLKITEKHHNQIETRESAECKQHDADYYNRQKDLDFAMVKYVRKPNTSAREDYLIAEIAKFDRLYQCIIDLGGTP